MAIGNSVSGALAQRVMLSLNGGLLHDEYGSAGGCDPSIRGWNGAPHVCSLTALFAARLMRSSMRCSMQTKNARRSSRRYGSLAPSRGGQLLTGEPVVDG